MNLLRQEIKPYFLEFSFIGLNSIKNSKRYDADTIAIKKKNKTWSVKRNMKYMGTLHEFMKQINWMKKDPW